jgi:hypothetical protein
LRKQAAIAGILAGMNNLASLAHVASPATPAFNSSFYTTAATVIPVLFLAIAVQGRMYDDLLKAYVNAGGRLIRPTAAALLAVLILFFGITGESQALFILYRQSATSLPDVALPTAIGLTVLAGASPAVALVKSVYSTGRELPARTTTQNTGGEPQEEQHQPLARISDTDEAPTPGQEMTAPGEAAPS